MDSLWAPWRLKYIKKNVKEHRGGVFTKIFRDKKKDKENFVFIRSKHAFAVLNIYPYNNGHSLIVPNRKVADLSGLSKEERENLMDVLEETKSLLDEVLSPQGYNIGINLGYTAGAGIPQHLHIHIVPRWKGDTNFMPVLGETKVISQSMTALYEQLIHANKKRLRKPGR